MVRVCGSVTSCFILKLCPHVSCFAFHFPLFFCFPSLSSPNLSSTAESPLMYISSCLPLCLCLVVCHSSPVLVPLQSLSCPSSHCFWFLVPDSLCYFWYKLCSCLVLCCFWFVLSLILFVGFLYFCCLIFGFWI